MESQINLVQPNIGLNPEGKPVSLDQVKKMLEEAKEEARQQTKAEIAIQIQNVNASLITAFGLFASILSFLTIEFQFLRTICSLPKILGFSLILFALLLGFNVALDYLVKKRVDQELQIPNGCYCWLVLAFLVIGTIIASAGNEENCKENQIYLRYSENFEQKFYDFDKKYNKNFEELDLKIKQHLENNCSVK